MKNLFVYLCLSLFVAAFNSDASEGSIIIGIDADMSAVAAIGGEAIFRGAKIAVDEINEQGGVLGKKLTIEIKDHRGNPRRGVANIQSFSKNKNVVAVIGGVHTPVALHELEVIHKNKMIYLSPWAAGTTVVDNGYEPNYVFRLSVRDQHAGHVLVNYAKQRGYKNVGLLLERTGWGTSNEKSMTRAATSLGLTISTIQWFNWQAKTLQQQIDDLIESGAEAILLVANAPEGAVFAKEMAALDEVKRLPIISHWGISGGAFVKAVGVDNISVLDINVIQTYSLEKPWNPKKADALIERYRAQFDSAVTANTMPAVVGVAHAYDLVYMLTAAIQQANSIERDIVRRELENIKNYDGLVKYFEQPFAATKHDALSVDDYIISTFNDDGFLTPVSE